MAKPYHEDIGPQKKTLWHNNGKTYFSKENERKLFFVLTLIMLFLGVLVKLGLF